MATKPKKSTKEKIKELKAPEHTKIPLEEFLVHEQLLFWRGNYSQCWNAKIYSGTSAYLNVDLQLIVIKANPAISTNKDILVPLPGVMRMQVKGE